MSLTRFIDTIRYFEMADTPFLRDLLHAFTLNPPAHHFYEKDFDNLEDIAKNQSNIHLSKLVKTTEDWYPSMGPEKNLLALNLTFYNIPKAKLKLYRVSVWGGDDFGMEKDFELSKEGKQEALRTFRKIGKTSKVTESYLKRLGFDKV